MKKQPAWCNMPAHYYGKFEVRGGETVVLEQFPAMDEALARFVKMPPSEMFAWGSFLEQVGQGLMRKATP